MTKAMEGTLLKWTNYFNGWQPRWFVLESGVLSYFKSQEDVINGCKGSIKMAVCDVNVHAHDSSRIDLIIPGEAHFYVKAATAAERQQWLVSLGSCKACLSNGKPSQPTASSPSSDSEEIPEDELKCKKSELRLYCDLLMQQVHSVKTSVQTQQPPDLSSLNEATSLLSATCDTFIRTLEDCMKIANAYTSHEGPGGPTPTSPTRKSPSTKTVPWPQTSIQRSTSVDSAALTNGVRSTGEAVHGYIPSSLRASHKSRSMSTPSRSGTRTSSESSETAPDVRAGRPLERKEGSSSSLTATEGASQDKPVARRNTSLSSLGEIAENGRIPTFFTNMSTSFMDIRLREDGGVPTTTFLDACRAILPLFDKLNPTAFAPVKLDIAGNIRKINQKYSTNTEEFTTLQSIVQYEFQHKQSLNSNSATIALLWLKRGLEFSREFITEYLSGVEDLATAANAAYSKTLKAYHSWVVRGVFALAVKSVPTHQELLEHLAGDVADVQKPEYIMTLRKDMDAYVTAQEVVVQILKDYYAVNGLDMDEKV